MRTFGVALLAGSLLLMGCAKEPSGKGEDRRTYTDAFGYEKALEVAKKQNKRLFVDFSASWCGPCRELKKVLHNPQVVEALRDYIVLMVDVDRDRDLAQEFGVTGIPAYFVVDGAGRKLHAGGGYKDVEGFLAWLNKAPRGG